MLLLTKIGEDIKREARIEKQRRRSRGESDRKVCLTSNLGKAFASFDF